MSHLAKAGWLLALLCILVSPIGAQDEAAEASEATDSANVVPLNLQDGPLTASLGGLAEIQVPEGVSFVGEDDMDAFNQMTGNPAQPC